MEQLLEQSDKLVARVPMRFERYLADRINWKDRLIGIKGSRGTGKTTLLLQRLHKLGLTASKAAYLSLDDLYFTNNSLLETGRTFHKQGGQLLAIDEVHKYPSWAREIKNLHDGLPDLKIIFTGSSIIDISRQEGDLSRRVLMYELHGMSYREYLEFQGFGNMEALSIQTIIKRQSNISEAFPGNFRPLEHFSHYLSHGYYPFSREVEESYHRRLRQLVRTIVEYDMSELKGFDIRNARKMLQLVSIIAQNVPFKPNLSSLAEKSKIHRNSLNNYLHFLEEARLIGLLYPAGSSVTTLQKPEKIYLNNPNLLYALSYPAPKTGTVREVFFYSQLVVGHRITLPKKGDFKLDDKYVFEIGGKSKSNAQIRDAKNAWVVKDDFEYPAGNSLPLWVFGFLY